ncbi:unnamed protein product [Brachionus calyciflorus]|uniref:GPI mannosyltransferase 2 n=1 Tax=Brachionus calyciflorus TaxID=104777 RepID=A0A813WWP0_9BILA|nr:unnamed protein product [Brachionus calyciflorus]
MPKIFTINDFDLFDNDNEQDDDYSLALQTQIQFDSTNSNEFQKSNIRIDAPLTSSNLNDPTWELIDPCPDIRAMFQEFDKLYFWNRLGSCIVEWSKRMTICAGIFYLREGGIIRLSEPLLQYRPRKDLVETLLHEMIHAYLYLTRNFKDRGEHGDEFKSHMNRINKLANTNITIYHSFHDEVKHARQHVWRCNGPCQKMPPFFGFVKRSMNRAPGKSDTWWAGHQAKCNGTFEKVSEPESYTKKLNEKKEKLENSQIVKKEKKLEKNTKTLDSFFSQKADESSQFSSQNLIVPKKRKIESNDDKPIKKLDSYFVKKEVKKEIEEDVIVLGDDNAKSTSKSSEVIVLDDVINDNNLIECPLCFKKFNYDLIDSHFVSNHLIEDHEADAFNPPKTTKSSLTEFLFNGFGNWDAKHFLHIAEHGYIYEHSSAFFPLYPLTINQLTNFFGNFLLNGVILNFIYFTISVIFLFKLTKITFLNDNVSLLTILFYVINPANIFFSSCYSESLYSMLTFSGLYFLYSNNELLSVISIFLSGLARSNGLVNFGYLAYFNLKLFFDSEKKFKNFLQTFFKLAFEFMFISSGFILYQLYLYVKFCDENNTNGQMRDEMIKYARDNGYKIFYDFPRSEWCFKKIPFSYSYVQSVYWNVGFLNYWNWKQIPNFVLAAPILCISINCIFDFLKGEKSEKFFNFLGLLEKRDLSQNYQKNVRLYPFVVHLGFLICSCLLFMHVQVSTRFICSSNPLIYWWIASRLSDKLKNKDLSLQLLWSKIIFDKKLKLIFYYFLTYSIIGTLLFSNFLPFT